MPAVCSTAWESCFAAAATNWDGFTAGAWRGTSIPEKPVRGIYFATHFHNFYHDAPVDEVQRYVEDMGPLGFQHVDRLVRHAPLPRFRLARGGGFPQASQGDLHVRRAVSGSTWALFPWPTKVTRTAPAAIRADVKGMRGAAFATDICTAKPEGRQYVLDNFTRLYAWAADLEPKWVMIWPYDSGGCGCGQCQPWGYGGYLRIAEPLARLARREFPGAKVMLSTWLFSGEEWAGLARALATRPDWVDYLLAEPAFSPGTPEFAPGISLAGETPTGRISRNQHGRLAGVGRIRGQPAAHPLPARVEAVKARWQGGFPYSEGIFEDINKVLFARFYWKPDTTADEALREYIAFEYSPEVVDLVLPAIRCWRRI